MRKLFYLLITTSITLASCSTITKENITFSDQETGMSGSIRGVDVYNESCVWISGSGGQYTYTTDAGESWTQAIVVGAEALDFRDVHAFDENSALLMSAGPGQDSRVYKTEDGGKTWRICYQNEDPAGFFDGMDFLNDKEGVIFSDPVDNKLNLLVTKDGGETWERLNPATLPEIRDGEYAFAASGTSIIYDWEGGIWIATGGSVARIWHGFSIDGPWEISTPPVIHGDAAAGLFSIAPRSDIKRIAVGGHYQKTDEKGSNVVLWDEQGLGWYVPEGGKSLPFMECVRWLSSQAVMAAGPPGVFFSPDEGQSWEEISEQGYHTFDVSEKGKIGWLASNKGKVTKMTWY